MAKKEPKTAKHIPRDRAKGPWFTKKVYRKLDSGRMIVEHLIHNKLNGEDHDHLAQTIGDTNEEWQAVANLMAAAPDLLAALEHLMRYDFGDSKGAMEARAAIKKAKGET